MDGKVTFLPNCEVNSKKFIHLADGNPHGLAQTPLQETKLILWCGIGSILVRNLVVLGRTGQLHRYEYVVHSQVVPIQACFRISQFQKCSSGMSLMTLYGCKIVLLHTSPHVVRQVLQQHFGDRVISRDFAVSCPPLSPFVTSMDFQIWGYLKLNLYT